MNIALKSPSKRQVVKDGILEMIRREQLRPGDQILSQNQLAEAFGVNPLTVIKALSDLRAENRLYRENGRGTFVGPKPNKSWSLAMMLPGENLDTPAGNPTHWPFVMEMVRTFIQLAGNNGNFSTVICNQNKLDSFDIERLRRFDLVFPFGFEPRERREIALRMNNANVSCPILLETSCPDVKAITVDHDRTGGVRKGINHLLALGYRKIGLVHIPEAWGDKDLDGYKEALEAFRIPFDASLTFRSRDGALAAEYLLSRDMPCDAVFCDTTLTAPALISRLERQGVKVPEDLGVMGYQFLQHLSGQPPHIACIDIPYEDMFRWAMTEFERAGRKLETSVRKLDFIGKPLAGRTLKETCEAKGT